MGSAPTFNIELPGATPQLRARLIQLLEEHLETYNDFELVHNSPNNPDNIDMSIEVPSDIDSPDTSSTDSITVNHMPQKRNEYAGNQHEGIIIGYQTYYGEDMRTLMPKLEFLQDLYHHLDQHLEDQKVIYHATASTI